MPPSFFQVQFRAEGNAEAVKGGGSKTLRESVVNGRQSSSSQPLWHLTVPF